MAVMKSSNSNCWKYTTNNESVANLSRLSLPLTISMIEQGSASQATYEDIFPDGQQRYAEGEILAASKISLAMIPEVPLLEHSPDNTKSDQAEQSETSQQVTDAHEEMTKFEHDSMGRNPVPADLISSCPRTRCEKRQEEMLSAKQSPRRRHQHLRPTAGQRRRHVQNRRIEDKLSARQAPKHEHSDVYSRNEPRHRMRRKHRGRIEWRDEQGRWHDRSKPRRHYRHKLGSAKTTSSKQGILSRFWLFCTTFARGCFGEYRKSH